ncbi:glycosyltransferase [Blastococcus sp. URHD0036]|uniref:glycosyltransferase n=1 Tax=Blastococcus sp. URHD0036 TaxID=1380356 RepID=UPI000496FCEE|nr:glycosyltransferase [Blastococcus sp. URHD0036]
MTGPAPLRILHLTDSLGVGGLERVVVTLAGQLATRGHDVTVAAEPGGALWAELPDGVTRTLAPLRRGATDRLRHALWLVRVVRSGEFDVVHAHQRGVALLARLARTGLRTRVVEHVHNVFPATAAARLVSFRGDVLVACGDAVAAMLVRDFGRSSARVTTVPNAVPDTGSGRDRTLPVTTGRRPTVLAVGRLSPQKDPLRFIDAVAELNHGMQAVDAIWIGEGELLEECRRQVRERDVPGLRFPGPSDDVPGRLAEADLVLLTSRWEGLPLVLLEAAAMGRAAVVPDVGGCGEAVEDGVTGLVYDVDADAATIAATVGKVLDPDTLTGMGASARTRYLGRYILGVHVDRVEEVYRRVLAR